MTRCALLILIPQLALAQTPPRIRQALPQPELPGTAPMVVDADDDGFPDLVYPSEGNQFQGLSGHAILVKNQGGRSFANPALSHFRRSDYRFDPASTVIRLAPELVPVSFINLREASEGDDFFSPVFIPITDHGTYGKRTPLAAPSRQPWVAVDLDGDDASELVQPLPELSGIRIWDRQPDGSYVPQAHLLDDVFLFDRATAVDLDNDGDLDLLLHSPEGQSTVAERTGPRNFAPATHIVFFGYESTDFHDLDGDGLPDAHPATGDSFRYYPNHGDFFFGAVENVDPLPGEEGVRSLLRVEERPADDAILTFAAGGVEELVVRQIRFGDWSVLAESEVDLSPLGPLSQGPTGLALADFDADGSDDLLIGVDVFFRDGSYSLQTTRRLAVAWGGSAGFSAATYLHPPPLSANSRVVADFNGDGSPDLIAGPDTGGRFALLPGQGDGTFGAPSYLDEIAAPAGAVPGLRISGLQSADFDGDEIPDLSVDYFVYSPGNGFQNACGIAKGRGDGSFIAPELPDGAFDFVSFFPCGMDHVIDWDGDGDLDVIGGGGWRENLGGSLDQNFRPLVSGVIVSDFLGNPTSLTGTRVGDLDGDGAPDIVSLVSRIEGTPPGGLGGPAVTSFAAIYFGDGLGGIGSIVELNAKLAGFDFLGNPGIFGDLAFADLNADGHADICLREVTGSDFLGSPVVTGRWRRNPGNGSRDVNSWPLLPLPSAAFPTGPRRDFDGDGLLEWVAPGGFLRATQAGPLISPSYHFTGGVDFSSARPVAAEDFDGDGDADFLLGDGQFSLTLVKNPLVNELSAITRALVAAGVKGSLAGPGRDADGDGRSNEDEFLLGTDPRVADFPAGNLLEVLPSAAGPVLQINYPPDAGALRLHYRTEMSDDLRTWTDCPEAGAVGETIPARAFFRARGWHEIDPEP